MGNMKQLNEFLSELKKEQMESAIANAKYYLDKDELKNAQQIIENTFKRLSTLKDKISDFITAQDALIMEPYNGEIIFRYKDKRFMFSLDKSFNNKSNDIMHLWHLDTDNTMLGHVDWYFGSFGSEELESLADKYLKSDKQEINMIPVKYYIWDNFKAALDNYINKLAN